MARKGHNRPASLVQIAGSGSTYPDDGSSPVGSNEWNANRDTTGIHGFTKKQEAISSYDIDVTDSYVEVTNAGEIRTMSQATGMGTLSTDNYPSDTSTKSFAEGDLLYLVKASGVGTVTLKHQNGGAGAGNTPKRKEFVGRWMDRNDQIDVISCYGFGTISTATLKVWGFD